MNSIPLEWARKYFEKSKDENLLCENLVVNEHGFMSYLINDDRFVVVNVYGDGQYWLDESNRLAKENNCTKIFIGTRRKPDAFIRKYKFKLSGYLLEKEVE